MAPKTVDAYVASLDGWRAEVVSTLRQLILETAPGTKESIKWAQPVYEENGPFAYIRAFKNHINFGFWRGGELPDPLDLMQGSGDRMRHIQLTGVKDMKKKAFKDFVRAAVKLNREKGDPTKRP